MRYKTLIKTLVHYDQGTRVQFPLFLSLFLSSNSQRFELKPADLNVHKKALEWGFCSF
uniref:Uncharacterized protein n=1 Tax=Physcomitrium patens TaxID=3218 RepID=A0A7I3ZJL9_PHYPA